MGAGQKGCAFCEEFESERWERASETRCGQEQPLLGKSACWQECGYAPSLSSPLGALISPAMRGGVLWAAVVLSVAGAACALGGHTGAPALSCGAQIPAQALPLRLRGGDDDAAVELPMPDTRRLLELGKCTG